MHDKGTVSIVGRSKDMIVRGGENVYPTEIEQFLDRHPDIDDVQVIFLNFSCLNKQYFYDLLSSDLWSDSNFLKIQFSDRIGRPVRLGQIQKFSES